MMKPRTKYCRTKISDYQSYKTYYAAQSSESRDRVEDRRPIMPMMKPLMEHCLPKIGYNQSHANAYTDGSHLTQSSEMRYEEERRPTMHMIKPPTNNHLMQSSEYEEKWRPTMHLVKPLSGFGAGNFAEQINWQIRSI